MASLRDCLPRSAHERDYALITTVDSLGTGSFLTVSVVLFVRIVGVSPTQVGTALGVGGLISLFARVPLGRLSDRLGHRRALIIMHLLRALTFPVYLVIHGFPALLVLSVLILVIEGWESPVRKVVLHAFTGLEDRVRVAAYNRSVYNLAFSVGSLLGELALTSPHDRRGLDVVVLANAASFLLAALLATRLPPDKPRPATPTPPPLCRGQIGAGLPISLHQRPHDRNSAAGAGPFHQSPVADRAGDGGEHRGRGDPAGTTEPRHLRHRAALRRTTAEYAGRVHPRCTLEWVVTANGLCFVDYSAPVGPTADNRGGGAGRHRGDRVAAG